jgi:hypothetical protein
MTNVNYAVMSDRELRQYFLTHREDQEAFRAYMDRRQSRPQKTVIQPDDPDWEEKAIAAIQTQLRAE